MRIPLSERFASRLLLSLEKGEYREELHPRDAGGRWARRGAASSVSHRLEAEANRVSALRSTIDGIAEEEAEDVRQQVKDHMLRIPTDYVALARRQDDRRRRAFHALVEATNAIGSVRPVSAEDAEIVSRAWRYAEEAARSGGKRELSEVPWDDEFRAVMTAAEGVLRRAAAAEAVRSR